ncbi:Lhr family helicase [Anatilimnocola floriformis]|uniref:Lhr family helicase n=1 Tax=Anatilimnocola floriformis TaxID=2948575 RepID=UPI0020C279B3|nr:DEAD/DEAH box helicase [Anatilimnocola floriformis]
MPRRSTTHESLATFHPPVREWFQESFPEPTGAQQQAWRQIEQGEHTLLLAPTGSGKTLAAFLVAINRIMFAERPKEAARGVKVLYISPLKALGADVERNLRAPIAGVRAVAERSGTEHHVPTVAVRSGDTSTADRTEMVKRPPDILITTPESLYLLLTSRSRDILTSIDTIIIDEIHSLVPGKRGAHLATSLERLEDLRRKTDPSRSPAQRIGLSATQRPLDEVARFLAGAEIDEANGEVTPRRVSIVEAGRSKQLQLRIEVPVEDMTKLGVEEERFSGPASGGPVRTSIWPSIHPRLVELIRQHRSTMIFVNSRRLAERLAGAVNELAGEEIALAHHGSIAKDTRLAIEDRLKLGNLPAIVATSSLELGIDMGAVDLVIQIEAPPSIASGIQRIGRAGHQVGAPSSGVIFPKYRGDLLACSAAAERMVRGEVEETRYPRNPLDVLAQQIVAMVALEPVNVEAIYNTVRRAAPYAQLPRASFEGVLDLLAGRYPSHEFAELRPRVNWDRLAGTVSPRKGSQRLAILNAGTIPDRGTYGVFLAGGEGKTSRVGELDEEMVFETRPGDIFLLGASSWRVLEITKDQVLVVPAPGESGKMPFWRGDGPGRPLEFGRAIGSLARRLVRMDREVAQKRLTTEHALDERAATNLLNYLHDQAAATDEPPSDKTIIVECLVDEVGDWRVCILSPFGSRVHAPWAMAVAARLRSETTGEVDLMWSDDGIVLRLPEADEPPPLEKLLPLSSEIEDEVVEQVGSTALFAARFRENAARALLLPRRLPGKRTPLWLQRRKAADLLSVAARYSQFPILLETYRECLRDVFDIAGLRSILQEVEKRTIRVKQVVSKTASPFASSLMFNYVSNFLYDGDAPLAERRAATLALDQAQLRELLGTAELRELLDADVIGELGLELQMLERRYPIGDADGVHDLLLQLGDLSRAEVFSRLGIPRDDAESLLATWLDSLTTNRRVVECRIGGESRFIAAEDAGRYRDALGVAPPRGLPDAFLQPVQAPLIDLVGRYARRHTPFRLEEVAQRLGASTSQVETTLKELASDGRVLEGEFLPGRRDREWCDAEVLRQLKRRSLARLREQVEPVEQAALARFLINWQGIAQPRRGLDGLLDVIEQLQGVALPASDWERQILPARSIDFRASDLDELCASGEVLWQGAGGIGSEDGRVAFYLTDHFARLAEPVTPVEGKIEDQIRAALTRRNAIFFDELARDIGGFKTDLADALWRMVWAGEVTNDTLMPLRSLRRQKQAAKKSHRGGRGFRSRRTTLQPGTEGRWSLLSESLRSPVTATEQQTARATQLIERYGIVTREMVGSEGLAGGFSAIYPVFKAMEESGRIRRGYFVAGLGAAQFAAPGADDRVREQADEDPANPPPAIVLAATDPANPYGAALPWPERTDEARPARAAGARVILHNGHLIGYLNRSSEQLLTFLPADEPQRSKAQAALVDAIGKLATDRTPAFLSMIDRLAPEATAMAKPLQAAGFVATSRGLLHRRRGA